MKDDQPQTESVDNVTYENQSTITGGSLSDVPREQRDGALRGAQLLAQALKAENVDVVFGYPGGANLEIFDVLPSYGIKCIRTVHEQGAVHAAQGFARAINGVGVCLATSGPGATNLVTGIADANSDSTPIVAITGNVPSHLLGRNAFQEVDIVGVTKPITKKNYQVTNVGDIPAVVREAFSMAILGRPGPVLIDIPKDIQQHYPLDADGRYKPPRIPAVIEEEWVPTTVTTHQLEAIAQMIAESKRPVIYAGGGIISADCCSVLLQVAEKLQIPVANTVMGHGIMPPGHPLTLDELGMHGSKYANDAVNEADLVLALGVRFDDRVTGNVDSFISDGKIIHIDIDRKELNKNKTVTLPICADIKHALIQIAKHVTPGDTAEWVSYVTGQRHENPFQVPASEGLSPQYVIDTLCTATNGDAVVSLGVGQHQMWAMQFYRSRNPHSFLSSSGFGTMGYGLPAAIGAKVALPPEQLVIDIDGDGSFAMTAHELATCYRFNIGVKVVVINNQWLGMVRQWQDMIYDEHRSSSDLSDPHFESNNKDDQIYPDFVKVAEAYGVSAERVSCKDKLSEAFDRLLADPQQPYLLDVIVEREENVYPMIPAGGTYKDIIMGDS